MSAEAHVVHDERTSQWRPLDTWGQVADAAREGGDLGALFEGARERCPVVWVNASDMGATAAHFVLDHDLVIEVARGFRDYSNAVGAFAPMEAKPLEVDPPEHTQWRRMLNPYFTGEALARIAGELRTDAVNLLQPLLDAGGGDFVAAVAAPLPMRAFCRICGIPPEDHDRVVAYEEAIFEVGFMAAPPEILMARAAPLVEYCGQLIVQRRESPRDDVVSGLVDARIDDKPLEDWDIIQVLMLLIGAGHTTTQIALTAAAGLLAMHESAQARLRDDPSLLDDAIEEILRYEPPVPFMPRVAVHDVRLGDRTVREGERVCPMFAAANFDPTAFPDPRTFRIDRTPNKHFTFGRGPHLCLGAQLARLELRIVLEELLARTSGFALAGPFQRSDWPDYKPKTLELTLTAAPTP